MLYHFSLWLKNYIHASNLFHYVSFRVMAALLSSLFFSFAFGGWFVRRSRVWFKSRVREYTPESHQAKDGMPSMGGLFMLGVVLLTAFVWCDLARPEVWVFLWCLVGFGAIGFWDDRSKIRHRKGISEKYKFRAQLLVALSVAFAWVWWCHPATTLCLPFFKSYTPDLSFLYIPWCVWLLVATSNAVNLTDGLDGLAIGSLIANFATFSVFVYIAGNLFFAAYLQVPFTGVAEITIIGAALLGASVGFLWYNTYPAQIFMGDVGSLALGAGLALMAIMAKQELLLAIAGGLFVLETLSVIVQVISFKLTGRRIFKMAPLHHHFELIGWPEAKITVRFAIITFILCICALMTLKMR